MDASSAVLDLTQEPDLRPMQKASNAFKAALSSTAIKPAKKIMSSGLILSAGLVAVLLKAALEALRAFCNDRISCSLPWRGLAETAARVCSSVGLWLSYKSASAGQLA